ncbi:MAG: DUF4440 domain-containing protein [Gemmatimonadetes bacterium]|nr:DUF4440 domain-containing protein [Gemmatimonadota bacterium]
MPISARLAAFSLVCCVGCSSAPAVMTAAHEAALRDSVRTFLQQHQVFMSGYPAGPQAQELGLKIYSEDVFYGGSVGSPEPVLASGRKEILFGARPDWLGGFNWTPDSVVIRPLAPGVASVTETYREQWSDTAGRSVTIRGLMMMVVKNSSDGWRITHFQASNPAEQETTLFNFAKRYLPVPGK